MDTDESKLDEMNGVRVMLSDGDVYEVNGGSLHKVISENQVTCSKPYVPRN